MIDLFVILYSPTMAQEGDVLVLTKALGTQVAVNAHQWMNTNPTRWEEISSIVTKEDGTTLPHSHEHPQIFSFLLFYLSSKLSFNVFNFILLLVG